MQTLRGALLALVLLAFAPLTAAAQTTPPAVVAGQTVLFFDHDGIDTTGYEICADTLSACTPVAVSRLGTTNVQTFIAPANLQRGDRVLRMRALWPGGTSDPSDVATFRVYVKPGKPGPVRLAQ